MPATCPSCQSPVVTDATFCARCGKPLPAPGPAKTSGLAIAAFILSFIPVCVNLAGVVLGIVALVKIGNHPKELKGRGLAIAAIIIGGMGLFVGPLAAIAIPNFVRFQARAKQAEARTSLKAIWVAEQAAELGGNRPATFAEIGFAPEPRRRYAYFFKNDALQPDIGGPYSVTAAIRSELPKDTLAIALASLDSDPTLDVWTVDSTGQVEHIVDDASR